MYNIFAQSMALMLVVLIVCICWFWHMTLNHPQFTRVKFEDAQFKTGDIILFHAYDNINSVFIGSYWGHIGIVYKDPDDPDSKPVIFEAARTSKMKNCHDYNKHGIMITDIASRIEKYPGLIACKSLNNPVNPDIIRGFKDFMNYAKKNMYYNENIVHNSIQKKMGGKFTNGTNCGELVVMSLIKLALLPETNEKMAHHLLYTAHLNQLQNNCYNNPVEITINPF
jgi:hypothetical protein